MPERPEASEAVPSPDYTSEDEETDRAGWIPTYVPDTYTGVDLLGLDDVNTLSAVLAAKTTAPPLAVGLFGDWGAGKSFFMARMQEEISNLVSQAASDNNQASIFCSQISQVRFNAWAASDRDPWPSMASAIFASVAGFDQLHRLERDPVYSGLNERQNEAKEELKETKEKLRQVDDKIRTSAETRNNVLKDLSADAGVSTDIVETIGDLGSIYSEIRQVWKLFSTRARVLSIIALVVTITLTAILVIHPSWLTGITAAVGWLAATVTSFQPTLSKARRVIRSNLEVQQLQRQKQELEAELAERESRLLVVGDEMRRFDGAAALPAYAIARAREWADVDRAGQTTVSELRNQLEVLSYAAAEARRYSEAEAGPTQPFLERIVVYVDDLDRCRPDYVVHVLESIKLLLDFPLFVVVIGVDARWLTRSLQIYFSDMLERLQDVSDEDRSVLTPQDYLEKIFQYCFVLPRLSRFGYANLIRSGLRSLDSPAVVTDATDSPIHMREAHKPSPRQLIVSDAEIDYACLLGALFETPRETKRLINVYQLVRASLPPDVFKTSATTGYRAILLLLAIITGRHADLALRLLRVLSHSDPDLPFPQFCDSLASSIDTRQAINEIGANLTPQESVRWSLLVSDLRTIFSSQDTSLRVGELRGWIPTVAKFSFYPWRLF